MYSYLRIGVYVLKVKLYHTI